ncbi:MAG: glycosyltransferase family 4 protein [Hyphomicrobiales bacterium]
MKIAVNTRLLLDGNLEGIGWFTYETLKRITQQHPEHEFIFFFDRPYHDKFIFADNVKPIVVSPQARHPFLYYIWFEYSIKRQLKKLQPDIFLSPDGYLSLSTNIPSIAVIHDLNFEHYPKDLPWIHSWHYRKYFPKYAQKASRIATVSNYSKEDICNTYNIDSNKVDVVYNGVNPEFKPINNVEKSGIQKSFSQGKPYFVYVGAQHPRKNIVKLFESFDLFIEKHKLDFRLVMVGSRKRWTKEIQDAFDNMKNSEKIIFTGRLDNKDLFNVVAGAEALTYISYFEGFGIPVIEAFNCDVPVITSNLTSLPEVAGEGALLINPFDVNEIANAMYKIATNEELRKDLIAKARIQRKKFSWQQSADNLYNCIMKTTI